MQGQEGYPLGGPRKCFAQGGATGFLLGGFERPVACSCNPAFQTLTAVQEETVFQKFVRLQSANAFETRAG